MIRPHWLQADDGETGFPPVDQALQDPDGLLAVGGQLSPSRLEAAYRRGIFPWYSVGQPVLWWSPDPRCVLFPQRLKVSRSLRKTLRKGAFEVSLDHAFGTVIRRCAQPRGDDRGTWITPSMERAYGRLHELGLAHSVEVWHQGHLVGGLYGVSLGKVFFGESMFSLMSDASKVAFVYLVGRLRTWGFRLIDCQVDSAHLQSLGAETIPRREFIGLLDRWCDDGGAGGDEEGQRSWRARLNSELIRPWIAPK